LTLPKKSSSWNLSSQGVIHRDIKPNNLIRRKQDNKLVLLDFGAVAVRKPSQSQLRTARSPSPLVLWLYAYRGKAQATSNSDIYALGIIGIQAPTKMVRCNCNSRRLQHGRAYLAALGACQPWIGDGADNDGKSATKDCYQSAKETSIAASVHWHILRSIPKHSRIPIAESSNSLHRC